MSNKSIDPGVIAKLITLITSLLTVVEKWFSAREED